MKKVFVSFGMFARRQGGNKVRSPEFNFLGFGVKGNRDDHVSWLKGRSPQQQQISEMILCTHKLVAEP